MEGKGIPSVEINNLNSNSMHNNPDNLNNTNNPNKLNNTNNPNIVIVDGRETGPHGGTNRPFLTLQVVRVISAIRVISRMCVLRVSRGTRLINVIRIIRVIKVIRTVMRCLVMPCHSRFRHRLHSDGLAIV